MDTTEYLQLRADTLSAELDLVNNLLATPVTSKKVSKKAPKKEDAVEAPTLVKADSAPEKAVEAPAKSARELAIERVDFLINEYPVGTYNPVPEYLHPLRFLDEEIQLHYLSSVPITVVGDALKNFNHERATQDGVDMLMMTYIIEPFAGAHDHDWEIAGAKNKAAIAKMVEALSPELFAMMKRVNAMKDVAADFQKMAREATNNA